MATLGQELREERERRTISIRDISDRTKIGTRILIALENDRWEMMPQKFFIKGVIKAYAETIGADPAVFLAKYDAQRGAVEEVPDKDRAPIFKKSAQVTDEELFESGEGTARFPWKIVLSALGVLLAAAAIYFLFLKPGSPPQASSPEKTAAPAETKISPPEIKIEEPKPAPVESGLKIEFRFNAESWMHVTADGATVMNGIMAAGTKSELRAEREFVVQTGNAGGFEFTLNGKPGRPLGGPGIVLTDIRITLENFATFLEEEHPPVSDADGR